MKNLVLILLITFISFNSFSQDSFCEAIVVEGKSSVKMVPEVITFNINFSVTDTNYTKCAELALQKIDKVKSQFTKHKIDKKLIKTLNYSIREEREHDPILRRQVFTGYRATIPILIKTKVNNSKNDRIFEIIKNNFQANFNLNFSLSPEQIETIKDELIELAVKDAKDKAKQLAKSAEIQLGKISKIQYGEPQTIRNFTRTNNDMLRSAQLESFSKQVGITSLSPMETEMRTSVMLAWEIKY